MIAVRKHTRMFNCHCGSPVVGECWDDRHPEQAWLLPCGHVCHYKPTEALRLPKDIIAAALLMLED